MNTLLLNALVIAAEPAKAVGRHLCDVRSTDGCGWQYDWAHLLTLPVSVVNCFKRISFYHECIGYEYKEANIIAAIGISNYLQELSDYVRYSV